VHPSPYLFRPTLAFTFAAGVVLLSACGTETTDTAAVSGSTDRTNPPTTATVGGSGTTNPSGQPERPVPPPGAVEIVDFRFSPRELTIGRSEAVTWTNEDPFDHWIVSTDPDVLDSGEMSQAQTYTKTFPRAGTYEYYCNIHNYMKATVTVR
jgi:plastocyanin